MTRFLWVCLAGALGTGLRYLVSAWLPARPDALPLATIAVNVGGCFLMGAVTQLAATSTSFAPDLRAALTVGFIGGLTTYSAFNQETTHLFQQGTARLALVNFGLTAIACLAAGLAGIAVAQRLTAGA